jgi:hypothetical protein
MYFIPFLLSIISLFIIFYKYDLREAIVKVVLSMSILIFISTEVLSTFNLISIKPLFIFWMIIVFLCLSTIYLKKIFLQKLQSLQANIKLLFQQNKVFILLICLVFVILTAIALTLTNNWDSYTYHLPRIEYWIQNGNVDFYPTNNLRQLYISPFSEYVILQVKILTSTNLFNNLIQLISLFISGVLISLISRSFNLKRYQQWLSIILTMTLPMALLQSSTTQTDLVTSMFVLSSIYYLSKLLIHKNFNLENTIFLGISLGIGILTKQTFYIFLAPFIIFFAIKYMFYSWRIFFKTSILLIILVLAVNTPFTLKNYNTFHSPLGPSNIEESINEDFSVRITLSNLSKNIALHLSSPNHKYNSYLFRAVNKFHTIIDSPINNNLSDYKNREYNTTFNIHHDRTGNFFHIILIGISTLYFLFSHKSHNKNVLYYLISTLLSYLIFAFLLKWQPWQTRLDLPFFMMFIPLITITLDKINIKYIQESIILLIFITSILIPLFLNPQKSIFGDNSIFLRSNQDYIFKSEEALIITNILQEYKVKNIALLMTDDSLEWQYWYYNKDKNFNYIYFSHLLTKTNNYNKDYYYKAVIIDTREMASLGNRTIYSDDQIEYQQSIGEDIDIIILKKDTNRIFTF